MPEHGRPVRRRETIVKKILLLALVPLLVLMAVLASYAAFASTLDAPRRWDRMVFLLEKTFLKVDAATATVVVDEVTAARLAELGVGRTRLDGELEREMAAAVLDTVDEAELELRFHVSFGKDRFLESSRKSLEKARKAGYIDEATEQRMAEELPERFAWMDDEGIHDGDRMVHTLRGDSVRTRYIAADGTELLDHTRVGPERRMVLLASFFGEKSEFRKGLLASLYED